jgi:hypothetical protein
MHFDTKNYLKSTRNNTNQSKFQIQKKTNSYVFDAYIHFTL